MLKAAAWVITGLLGLLLTTKVIKTRKESAIAEVEKKLGPRLIWGTFVLACAMWLLVFRCQQQSDVKDAARLAAKTPVYTGLLEPASDPIPRVADAPDNAVFLLLGSTIAFTTNRSVVLKCGTQDVIKLRMQDGRAFLSAKVIDSRGRHTVVIHDNAFQTTPDPERVFFPRQSDASSYVVYDLDNVEVLRMRYMNPRTLFLTGRFVLGGGQVVDVEPDVINLPGGGMMIQNLLGGARTDIKLCD